MDGRRTGIAFGKGLDDIGLLEDPATFAHVIGGIEDGIEDDVMAGLVDQGPVAAPELGLLTEIDFFLTNIYW